MVETLNTLQDLPTIISFVAYLTPYVAKEQNERINEQLVKLDTAERIYEEDEEVKWDLQERSRSTLQQDKW